MTKRKLSLHQSERVRQQHQKRLSPRVSNPETPTDLGPEQPGIVVANYGASLDVEGAQRQITLCSVRQNLGELVCGDNVVWRRAGNDGGVVVAVRPRRSLLVRTDAHGHAKPVAANVDIMQVVISPLPEVSEKLLDAYLVAAELCNVTPLIIVNKCDLLDATQRRAWEQRMTVYRSIGYDVVFTSTGHGSDITPLLKKLDHHTSVVVGHSGVGKSSLLKALLPGLDIAIGDVSVAGLGKHTTSTARLYHITEHAHVIDSPGVRDVKLGKITPEQAAYGFPELRPYLGQCKFKDCRHRVEPDCAIRAAQLAGHIAPTRLASYHRLLDASVELTQRSR